MLGSSRILARTLVPCIVVVATVDATAGTKATSTWSADDLAGSPPAKILVLARVTEESARRTLEDSVVRRFRDLGVEAVAAYDVLSPEDLASEEALVAKADALGIDSGILFTVTGESTKVKSGSNVHASVGVPVRAGPFSVFLGTSVPLGGGPKNVQQVEVKAEMHARGADNPRWIATFSTDLSGGVERSASEIAKLTVKSLKKAKLFR